MTDSDFERSLAFVLKWEGGYVDDPDDSGGATNRGITQATYDRFRSRHARDPQPVISIPTFEVEEIYRVDYWLPSKAPRMEWPLCLAHFDGAVNCGLNAAAKMLQRALGVEPDGVVGPVTLGAVRARAADALAAAVCTERSRYYDGIVARRPTQRKFLQGWMNRLQALRKEIEG